MLHNFTAIVYDCGSEVEMCMGSHGFGIPGVPWDSHGSHGIPMGMGIRSAMGMGMGWEWELNAWEWELRRGSG